MAAAFVNIGGDSNDRFHRYTRPVIAAQRRGGGNGKFTVLTNLADVATALRRPVPAVHKYLSRALSCGGSHDDCSLRGWHTAAAVEAALQDFVRGYVLCPRCGDAGTRIKAKGSRDRRPTARLKCGACGFRSDVADAKLFAAAAPARAAAEKKSGRSKKSRKPKNGDKDAETASAQTTSKNMCKTKKKKKKGEKKKKRAVAAGADRAEGWLFASHEPRLQGWSDHPPPTPAATAGPTAAIVQRILDDASGSSQ